MIMWTNGHINSSPSCVCLVRVVRACSSPAASTPSRCAAAPKCALAVSSASLQDSPPSACCHEERVAHVQHSRNCRKDGVLLWLWYAHQGHGSSRMLHKSYVSMGVLDTQQPLRALMHRDNRQLKGVQHQMLHPTACIL